MSGERFLMCSQSVNFCLDCDKKPKKFVCEG
jgi:hypothetical protein